MLRRCCFLFKSKLYTSVCTTIQRTFLTNAYMCSGEWNARHDSEIFKKVNLDDLYTVIDQQFNSKGVISAIDVDIFANSVRDLSYLGELRDLLHKLRLSAETCKTLPSTHHATIRSYLEFGQSQELIEILADPMSYGIFLDDFCANILLDKLIKDGDIEKAARVASIFMLQEDFKSDITCFLTLYASLKYLTQLSEWPTKQAPVNQGKVEEIKIRIKYLRNPYFDDHFDIEDKVFLVGKTLALIGKRASDNLHNNLQLIGWLYYNKLDKFLSLCEQLCKSNSFQPYPETIELLNKIKELKKNESELISTVDEALNHLSKCTTQQNSIETDLKTKIENAINFNQNTDVQTQTKLYQEWDGLCQKQLDEQSQRLMRSQKLVELEQKKKALDTEEQKLWFFENKDKIELQIESKEVKYPETDNKKSKKDDDNYIPPEIVPKKMK